MDIATLFGILAGLGLIFLAIFLHEGMKGVLLFLNTEAILVVLGGTLCATLINYSLSQFINVLGVAKNVFFTKSNDVKQVIATFVNLSQKARREGLIALEHELPTIKSDFMKRGVQMVIDGQDQDSVTMLMETEMIFIKERHKVGQEIFIALGTYSPAFGIIGTVLGMILMLGSISDVEQVPARMAIALTSAFFGLGSGYLIFLPIAGKLRRRSEEELFTLEMIVRGVLLLQSGTHPKLLEDNLNAYLDPKKRMVFKQQQQQEAVAKA